jgi:hypothetical protein
MGDRRGACRVLVGKPGETAQLEDLAVDGRIIFKWIFEKWGGDIDWIDLDQNTDRWWALVNAVMNLRIP